MDLDFMPSPVEDRPGLLIRDPFRYSDATLIVPPALIPALECFDGEQTELDLRSTLFQITGDLQVGDLEKHLIETLSAAGFLEDDIHEQMKVDAEQEFARAPLREAVHAGGAYPDTPEELDTVLKRYLADSAGSLPVAPAGKLVGIAAPHVSPEGGWQSYRAAYSALTPDLAEKTFVILGTSHYGHPDRFGLTRKPFLTPYGEARTDVDRVNLVAALSGDAVQMEDYCHAMEHSIEFQVLFLQHLYGPQVKILPILCGSYARSVYVGGMPEENEAVNRFIGVLGDLAASQADDLFWILGVDMAHIGRRYGDRDPAKADAGQMLDVADRDRRRMKAIAQSDVGGFWNQVQQNRDDLKWCGSAPFYTFLRVLPGLSGQVRRYQQWNIDEQSVVSFAGISFYK